jgi:hypothetical protein
MEATMEKPTLQREHEWLQQLMGEWSFEAEMTTSADGQTIKQQGTESVRSLEGTWVICEMRGVSSPGDSIMTLGFDPRKGRFVGTFVSSMMTHMWLYDGSLDPSRKILTLDSEGPSFEDPEKLAPYQDVIEIKNADERVLSSRTRGSDGKWTSFMRATYRRTG